MRRIFRVLPHEPRCQLCAAPFAGAVAPVMRALGKRPADKNPRVCQSCFSFIAKHHGGAEIDASFMFADIRGSTTLAERMSAAEFHALLDRFYATASNVVFDHDGAVDKFVGDEVVAMYFPIMSGPQHAARAVETAPGAPASHRARGPGRTVGPRRRRRPHRSRVGRRRRRRVAHGDHGARRHGQHDGAARVGRGRRGGPGVRVGGGGGRARPHSRAHDHRAQGQGSADGCGQSPGATDGRGWGGARLGARRRRRTRRTRRARPARHAERHQERRRRRSREGCRGRRTGR